VTPDSDREHVFSDTRPRDLPARLRNPDDTEAWGVFETRYAKRVYNVGRRNGLSHHEADELAQRVRLAVAKAVGTYDPVRCRFRTWLWGVVLRRFHEVLRLRRVRDIPPVEPPEAVSESEQSEEMNEPTEACVPPDLDALFREEERVYLVEETLKELKRAVRPIDYEIFYAKRMLDKSAKGVAEAFGKSVSNVDVITSRVQKVFEGMYRTVVFEYEHGRPPSRPSE